MSVEPGLFVGTIRHRRFQPRAHQFCYSLFMTLLDIDQLVPLLGVSRLIGRNRWNVASFYDRDHIGDPSRPLRDRLRESALAAGHRLPDGRVFLLTHLRYAGYVFNPISVYYCLDRDSRLRLVLADVRNTYGGRRSYWLTPIGETERRFRAVAAKSLYVSPFMTMSADYEFVLTDPASTLGVQMNVVDAASRAPIFDATLTLARRPWTAAAIRRVLASYPLMTAKVIGGIHFEALRLRLKGLSIVPAPRGRH